MRTISFFILSSVAASSLVACNPNGFYGGGSTTPGPYGSGTAGDGTAGDGSGPPAPPPPPPEELATTGAASGLTHITTDAQTTEDTPTVSHDGTWLLYTAAVPEYDADNNFTGNWSARRIMKARADGRGGAVMLSAESGQAYSPSWLPNGTSYVSISNAMGGIDVLRSLKVSPNAASSRVLAEREVSDVRGTVVSPDGTRVAFHSTVSGQPTLGTVHLNGSELTNLVPGQWPAWSPDGKQLAFQRETNGKRALYITDAETGSELTQLTDGSDQAEQPTWSPDGKYIAFTSNRGWNRFASGTADGSYNLFVVRADGSGLVQLTEGNHPLFSPSWGADGWIYFASGGDLWRIQPDMQALAAGQ